MFNKVSTIILISWLVSFWAGIPSALGEDHGGAAPAAENGSGEPGAAAGEAGGSNLRTPKSRAQKNFDEWLELSQKLEKAITKAKAKKQTIEDLIKDKDKEKDEAKKLAIISELNTHHHEYVKIIQDYEKLRIYVLYRFPERSNENKRTYTHVEAQSVDEIEKGMGIEAKVKKIIRKISVQYPEAIQKDSTVQVDEKENRMPASDQADENVKTGITETVILKK